MLIFSPSGSSTGILFRAVIYVELFGTTLMATFVFSHLIGQTQ
jgi:hypothetical protein